MIFKDFRNSIIFYNNKLILMKIIFTKMKNKKFLKNILLNKQDKTHKSIMQTNPKLSPHTHPKIPLHPSNCPHSPFPSPLPNRTARPNNC
jgi:hypothetical protein